MTVRLCPGCWLERQTPSLAPQEWCGSREVQHELCAGCQRYGRSLWADWLAEYFAEQAPKDAAA